MPAFLIKVLTLKRFQDRGFTIVFALSMGLIMMAIATTLIFRASRNEAIASSRTETGDSLAVAEAGVARILVQFTKPENAVLLNRNYDPLISGTNKNYLGADGIPNTDDDDDTNSTIDEWTGFSPPATSPCPNAVPNPPGSPSVSFDGTIGSNGQYQLLAYRYDRASKTGNFLISGQKSISGQSAPSISYIGVTVSITDNFPGVLVSEPMPLEHDTLKLTERKISGKNGNLYFDAASHNTTDSILNNLNGSVATGDSERQKYLKAVEQNNPLIVGSVKDNISGKIYACRLESEDNLLYNPQGTDLGDITNNLTISGNSGQITYYQANKIYLDSKTIDVDTTNGPVYLFIKGQSTLEDGFIIKGTAKIRNIRTDGNSPKVGDLRIIVALTQEWGQSIRIFDTACIQTAFIYNPNGDLALNSSGSGCNSGHSNIDGVVWVEDIDNQTGSDAGITVPDDVSSLTDLTTSVGLPTINKVGSIQSWQRYKL